MHTVLITGANRGIGLALARCHRQRGDQVVAVCRQRSAELDALDARVEAGIELTDGAALARLAGRLDGLRIDRLIACAGVLAKESLEDFDGDAVERIRRQFEVNAVGPLQLVAALLGRLAEGAKVAIITSRMGSIADNGSGGYYGYRMSKAAVNAAGRSLAHDLRPRGVAVFLLHPGFVRTDMTGGKGDVSPEQSAANLVERIDTLGFAESGSFWHANGQPLPW